MAIAEELKVVVRAEVDRAKRELQQFNQSLQKTERSARDSGGAMRSMGQSIGRMVAAGVTIAGTVRAIQALSKAAIEAASSFEVQRTEFGIFLGDIEEGEDLFNELRRLSARTPLQMETISNAAKQLISFGTEVADVEQQIQMLGDASLGNAQKLETLTRAFGRVQARGRASMEEVNMAMEAGLPIIDELAEQMGVTKEAVFDLISTGKVGFGEWQAAFEEMTGAGGQFEDGMVKLSETFAGKVSTMKDNWTAFLDALTNLEPFKNIVGAVSEVLSELTDMVSLTRAAMEIQGRLEEEGGAPTLAERVTLEEQRLQAMRRTVFSAAVGGGRSPVSTEQLRLQELLVGELRDRLAMEESYQRSLEDNTAAIEENTKEYGETGTFKNLEKMLGKRESGITPDYGGYASGPSLSGTGFNNLYLAQNMLFDQMREGEPIFDDFGTAIHGAAMEAERASITTDYSRQMSIEAHQALRDMSGSMELAAEKARLAEEGARLLTDALLDLIDSMDIGDAGEGLSWFAQLVDDLLTKGPIQAVLNAISNFIDMVVGAFRRGQSDAEIISGNIGEAQEFIDDLAAAYDDELDLREDFVNELRDMFDLEFDVLRDAWERNLISTEEFIDGMTGLNEQQAEAVGTAEKRSDVIDQIEALKDEIDAAQAELDAMTEWEKFWSNEDERLEQMIDMYEERIRELYDELPSSDGSGWDKLVDFFTQGRSDEPVGGITVNVSGDVYGDGDLGEKILDSIETARSRFFSFWGN